MIAFEELFRGTLTQTSAVDAACFVQALADTHQVRAAEVDWHSCPHISDSGITQHLFQTRFGRAPYSHEEQAVRGRLVALLEAQCRHDSSQFVEVAGAVAMLERLTEKQDWLIAVATGCWQASAELKLRAANIELGQTPAGFAEDGPSRARIVRTAIERATTHYQRTSFEKIVSVGDGVWDVRTAMKLGLSFVGMGSDTRAESLLQLGAQHVVPDFSDGHQFFTCLDNAVSPRQSLSKSV